MFNVSDSLYICSTHRLVRAVRQHLNRKIAEQTHPQATPQVMTLAQWLQTLCTQAMLTGVCAPDALPTRNLSAFAENALWQQAIAECLKKNEFAELFNMQSLADAAQKANQMLIEWQVADAEINTDFLSVETRQFLRWREVFRSRCKTHDALEPARLLALQIDLVKNARLSLPKKLVLWGFDRITPLEQGLIDALRNQQVEVTTSQARTQTATQAQTDCENVDQECRAAVAWAQEMLQANPNAKLAIVSPVMHRIRRPLQDLLDDTFHPQTLYAHLHETPRIYDFSLGFPLGEQPMVRTALNLIRLACSKRNVLQQDVSTLLLDVYWSAWDEHDLRARIDALLRKKYLRSVAPQHIASLIEQEAETAQLHQHFKSLLAFRQQQQPQYPSAWCKAIETLFNDLNWSKTRPQSSFEYQAHRAWGEVLQQFAELDAILGKIDGYNVSRQLWLLCSQKLFQPENISDTRIQVLGILESTVEPLDGVWVIGMNDSYWPPMPNPNPLLPYPLQRSLNMPGADSASQSVFARTVFDRLSHSARHVIFSWSHHEDDRELRPSPLLQDLTVLKPEKTVKTLAENMAKPAVFEFVEDSTAPPVGDAERVRGGTKLLEAQAICPAWAFYQYRLGARKLDEPSDGLDQLMRGNLVHAALQKFWETHRDSSVLHQPNLPTLIETAVQQAIDETATLVDFPQTLIRLERNRLYQLLGLWLAYEAERSPFSVHACERDETVLMHGLQIRCRIDRIDALDDGLVVIDYKTGTPKFDANAWAKDRTEQLQLPFYASIVLQDEAVVGACFAFVNADECTFAGAADVDIGAGFKPMHALAERQVLARFDRFETLLQHWRTQLDIVANEIMQGVANVRFEDEKKLDYCDVKPLLRLPEREWQFEHLTK